MNKGYIYIFITAFAFSTMEIVGKMIATEIDPFQLTFIRFLMGGLILLPFAIQEVKRRKLTLGINDCLFFIVAGVIGIVISMSFFQFSILYTKASIVAAIFSTNAVFTIPFAYLVLKEKITRRMTGAISICILGVLLIFNPFSFIGDMKGMILAIMAAVTFSLYSVINKTRIEKYGSVVLSSFSFIIGAIILLVALVYFDKPIITGITGGNIAHILYLGIFVTGIGYLCYFEAMRYTSAITASMVFFIKPALAPMLAFFIIKEELTLSTVLGIICITFSSILLFVKKKTFIER